MKSIYNRNASHTQSKQQPERWARVEEERFHRVICADELVVTNEDGVIDFLKVWFRAVLVAWMNHRMFHIKQISRSRSRTRSSSERKKRHPRNKCVDERDENRLF